MFARIPGLRRNAPDSVPPLDLPSASSASRLLSLHLRPSVMLWRVQLTLHMLLGMLLVWALVPWMFTEWVWLAACVLGLLVLTASARSAAHRQREQEGVLELTETGWSWLTGSTRRELVLSGAVVVWSGLVVLPFAERSGRRRKTLVLLSDSCTAEDLRLLRVWLLTALPRV